MTSDSSVLELVRCLIAAQITDLPAQAALLPEKKLNELGIDSLATVSLLVGLSEETGAHLEDFADDLELPTSVHDLCVLAEMFMAGRRKVAS
jgi:acyl carrier protein